MCHVIFLFISIDSAICSIYAYTVSFCFRKGGENRSIAHVLVQICHGIANTTKRVVETSFERYHRIHTLRHGHHHPGLLPATKAGYRHRYFATTLPRYFALSGTKSWSERRYPVCCTFLRHL